MTGHVAKIVALVTLLATACTLNPATASHSPTPSNGPSKIAWTGCGGKLQCGNLQVPLDYSKPDGKKVSLALIRQPVTNPAKRIGSLLLNPGGPGESGIQFLRDDLGGLANLNQRFDLVAWDPRGAAQSTPVTCVDGPTLDNYLSLDSVLDDPQEKQATVQSDKDFAAGCQSRSGELLPFMDTASTARDLEQIRAALGDPKLSYLGLSYGTYIGQWYAHLFPTRVRALSLDGVVDPMVSANDSLLGQVVGFEKNLEAYLAGCSQRATCIYGRTGDPTQKLVTTMNTLDTTPLRVGNRLLTRSLAMTGVLVALYSQDFWALLDSGLTALYNGDGSFVMRLADLYNQRNADGTYGNLFNGAYAATFCLDFPAPTDLAAYDQLGPTFAKASSFFGPWSQYSNLGCAYWPVKRPAQGPLAVTGAPPILLVGGTNDPATPFSEAQSVNRQIQGSVLLTRQGNGHTSFDSSVCSRTAEEAYLINLTMPPPGTVCSS